MTELTNILNQINADGYTVISNVISVTEDDMKNLNEQIETKPVYIFNQDWDNNDMKRSQTLLNKDGLSFISHLDHFVSEINPTLKMSNWVIIKSDIGCQKQMVHLDYLPTPEFMSAVSGDDKSKIPLLCLVGLMDETYIYIWKNGFYTKEAIKSTKLTLNSGDVLVFRADVIHAGSEYDKRNIGLHCYLDSECVARDEDTTFIVSLDEPELTKLIIE